MRAGTAGLRGLILNSAGSDTWSGAIDQQTKGCEGMNARRIAEIEDALLVAIPNEVYQPDLESVICQQCNGATDDHKANCYVPMVYELLREVKRLNPAR
jgi:hypothetical protein